MCYKHRPRARLQISLAKAAPALDQHDVGKVLRMVSAAEPQDEIEMCTSHHTCTNATEFLEADAPQKAGNDN